MKAADIKQVLAEHPQAVFRIRRKWSGYNIIINKVVVDTGIVLGHTVDHNGEVNEKWERPFVFNRVSEVVAFSIDEFVELCKRQAKEVAAEWEAKRALQAAQREIEERNAAAIEGNEDRINKALATFLGTDKIIVNFDRYHGNVIVSIPGNHALILANQLSHQ